MLMAVVSMSMPVAVMSVCVMMSVTMVIVSMSAPVYPMPMCVMSVMFFVVGSMTMNFYWIMVSFCVSVMGIVSMTMMFNNPPVFRPS